MDIHDSVFIADGAKVIGYVTIKKDVSIWCNVVVRSDLEGIEITIGERTNIQDGSVVHVDTHTSTIIGNDVTIGHNCTIHACTIEDGCLIGMGATVLTGAHIKKGAIVGAGALVKENMVIEENMLAVGVPAKAVKKLPAETYDKNIKHAAKYVKLTTKHKEKKFRIVTI